MDADQPAELALGPAIRKPELPDGATDGRSADQLRIRRLTPGRRAHFASLATWPHLPVMRPRFGSPSLPLSFVFGRRASPEEGVSGPGKVRIRAITKNGRTNERKKQERPPHRGEAFFRDGAPPRRCSIRSVRDPCETCREGRSRPRQRSRRRSPPRRSWSG